MSNDRSLSDLFLICPCGNTHTACTYIGVSVKPELWTLDWTGLDWTGPDWIKLCACALLNRIERQSNVLVRVDRIYHEVEQSLNAVLKKKVDYKQHEWPKFNEQLKQLIEGQRDEVIRSLSGRGQYRLFLSTSILEWSKMRPEQRKMLITDFDSSSLRSSGKTKAIAAAVSQSSETGCTTPSYLSIDAEDSGIETLPLVTLQCMWEKASKLLTMGNGITAAPSDDKKARMTSSFSGKTPHFVSSRSGGQYVCDSTCIQWNSAKICSHTLAVAEANGELKQFLQWYSTSGVSPNITILAMEGLPKGRAGQKGGRAK